MGTPRDWYALLATGEIQNIGPFDTFGDASDVAEAKYPVGVVWVASPDQAAMWRQSLAN